MGNSFRNNLQQFTYTHIPAISSSKAAASAKQQQHQQSSSSSKAAAAIYLFPAIYNHTE
jgi:hypothetical protein